jgi:hypothetical protein
MLVPEQLRRHDNLFLYRPLNVLHGPFEFRILNAHCQGGTVHTREDIKSLEQVAAESLK